MNIPWVHDYDTTELCGYPSRLGNGIHIDKYRKVLSRILSHNNQYGDASLAPEYVPFSDITTDQKYVYCININNHINYFIPKFCDGITIPNQIRTDIITGRALLLFEYIHEGMLSANQYSQVCAIIAALNLPKNRIVLLHGDHSTDKFLDAPFTYQPYDTFPTWLEPVNSLIDYVPEKLFVTYNRVRRVHRLVLVTNLIKNGLINDGIVSLGAVSGTPYWLSKIDASLNSLDCQNLYHWQNHSPDGVNLTIENPANTINLDHHRRAFLSLVSETLVESNCSFFSEKIYKPICIGHPFILLGNPYSLQRLHSQGYKTFSQWWDESYDSETDYVVRIHKIMRVLEIIKSWPDSQKQEIRKNMTEILQHNQKVFLTQREKLINREVIADVLRRYLL